MLGSSVITAGYVPYARVLAESFRETNPHSDFVVLLVDDHDERVGRGEPFDVLRPADVGISRSELNLRGLMYAATELVCSLRPALMRHLLNEGAQSVVLMDADGCVYGDLEPIAKRAEACGILFSPHLLSPHAPPEEDESLELLQVRYGVINGGFVAVGPEAMDFLNWLDVRLARHCVNAPERGLYLDQRWLDLAVGLFPNEILNDPGCNVMCLNLQDRDIVWSGERPTMVDGPLRYFHFLLAFDPERPEWLCNEEFARRWLPYLARRSGARRLAHEYAQRLLAHGATQSRRRPQYYDKLPAGLSIDRHIRAAYRRGVLEAEVEDGPLPPNPFDDNDTDKLLRWLADACGDELEDAGLSRYRRAIRDIRPDLKIAFPFVPGEHTQRFLAWLDAERDGDWIAQYAIDELVTPRLDGKIRIDRRMRELYLDALSERREIGDDDRPPNPYLADTAGAFLAWLKEPDGEESSDRHASRYLARVRAERPDLLAAFPNVPGADTDRYLEWAVREANKPEVAIPSELLPEV